MKKLKDIMERRKQEKEIKKLFEYRIFTFLKQILNNPSEIVDKISMDTTSKDGFVKMNPYEWYNAFVMRKLSKWILFLTIILLFLTLILVVLTCVIMWTYFI